MLTTALLGPKYLYMPELPLWLHWAIYVAMLAALAFAFLLMARKLRRLRISGRQLYGGLRRALSQHPSEAFAALGGDVLGQRRVRRDRYGGTMHGLIFYSFCVLLLGTTLIGVQHDITTRLFGTVFLRGDFYLGEKALLDTAALALITGVCMAMWRRYRSRPVQLGARQSIGLVYSSLLFMSVSGLMLEATRELLIPTTWSWWTYAGHTVAMVIHPLIGGHVLLAYETMWGVHVAAAFTLIGVAAATTLDHAVILPTNLVLGTNRTSGLIARPFDLAGVLEAEGDLENLTAGFANPAELSWDRRLMVDACINCGRCEAACPATAAGRPLSPRLLVQALRDDLHSGGAGDVDRDVFARRVLSEESLWSCLTCSACRQECPAGIDQPGLILDMRRHLAEKGQLDEQKAMVLSGLERNQNPLGLPSYQRADWLTELGVQSIRDNPDVEYLYWIGCMASYDQRARDIVRAMMKILDHVGITFAILGNEEQCHGECQRRLGDEAGFQLRTMELSEQLRGYGVKKILTHCPHCMNTFTNDYREFGIDLEVVHHSQLLAQLIDSKRLNIEPASGGGSVAYHDPCNLGRILGVYDAPRTVVKASVGDQMVEFERSRDRSFCCGAGGANYFYKVPAAESVSGMRITQARDVGAQTVATACPFCMAMLEDASCSGEAQGEMKVMDLSELVAGQLPSGAP